MFFGGLLTAFVIALILALALALAPVSYRQWMLSVPKRVRRHLQHEPEVVSGLLRVCLRAVESMLPVSTASWRPAPSGC